MGYEGFDKLAKKVGPGIAAAIGRAKYGKKKFDKAAGAGKKLKGAAQAKNKKANFAKLKKGTQSGSHHMGGGKMMKDNQHTSGHNPHYWARKKK